MKYAWIRSQKTYSVRKMCQVLSASTSGYYAWAGRKPSARHLDNARLLSQIRLLHTQSREAYGTERIWHALRRKGETCGRNRVQRLRQINQIQSRRRRRYVHARAPYQRQAVAPNRLKWPFVSPGRDRVWVADITFIPTRQGWLYLAAILDLYTRRIAGWAMGERADQQLASAALNMALQGRKQVEETIHHSDQGVQYTSNAYRQQLETEQLVVSTSRKGMPYDNAVMESFFGSLKQELTHHEDFASRDQARVQVFDYIEVFYNRQRIHSALGYRTPLEFSAMNEVRN